MDTDDQANIDTGLQMLHILQKGLCLEIRVDAIRNEIKEQLSFIVWPHEAGVVIKRDETVGLITVLTKQPLASGTISKVKQFQEVIYLDNNPDQTEQTLRKVPDKSILLGHEQEDTLFSY